MEAQNYSNHVRVHPLFHYFVAPLSLLMIPAAIINLVINFGLAAIILFLGSVVLHLVAAITRSYAKKNQDRIILTEMRLRYYLLTGKSIDLAESKLSLSQILALRFASDEELKKFLQDPFLHELSADGIKKRIQQWKPDHLRV